MTDLFGRIEWSQVSALAACVGVVVALIFHIKNLVNTWLSNSAKMVVELSGTFNSEEMRGHRRQFAQLLLFNRNSVNLHNDNEVLEFFEEIAYMTRRGVLDKGMVWNSLFWHFERYYLAVIQTPSLIDRARTQVGNPVIYREIGWLYAELCKVSAREKGAKDYLAPAEEHWRQFLQNESTLRAASDPPTSAASSGKNA